MTSATIFPDTTILIQYQSIDQIDWRKVLGVKHVKLMLTSAMLQEIEDIKNQDISPALAKRATIALNSIGELLSKKRAIPPYLQIKKATPPLIDFSVEQLDPNSIADLLVATVIAHQSKHALEFVVLLTDDAETRAKAKEAGLEVASLPKNYLASNEPEPSVAQKNPFPKKGKQKHSGQSPKRLADPTPLFKNKLLETKPEEEPATNLEQDTLVGAPESANKLFQVIEPEETQPHSRVVAIEQPLDANSVEPTKSDIETHPPELERELLEADDPAREEKLKDTHAVSNEAPSTPFIDIKQEPARPDRSSFDFSLPQVPIPAKNGSQVAREKVVPPTPPAPVIEEDAEAPAEPSPRYSHSFSFTSQSSSDEKTQAKLERKKAAITEPVDAKPELRLAFEDDDSRTAIIIHHPEYPSIDEVGEQISAVRKSYPKLALLGVSGGDGVGNGISQFNEPVPSTGNDLIYQRHNTRIKRYNDALDSFYASSEKYLSEVAEFQNLRRRSAKLDLILLNNLPDSLKSLYIAIHFPSNLRVYSEDNLPEHPAGPAPPEEPNLDALFDRMRLPSVPVPGELSAESSNIKMRSRNLAPIEVRWNKGWDVIYSLREIEKNEQLFFNPLFIVFNSFEQATSFRIQFRITVASASYEEKGNLEVLVRKEI